MDSLDTSTTTRGLGTTSWRVLIMLGMAVFTLTTLAVQRYRYLYVPTKVLAAEIPDAAKVGDVGASIAQMKELWRVFQDADWNLYHALKREDLMHLADARFAEDDVLRKGAKIEGQPIKGPSSFTFYASAPDPEVRDVAFYTSIYVRANTKQYHGTRSVNTPSGFYLVAFKNGDIKQVPVTEARLFVPKGKTYSVVVFPGMKAYDADALPTPEANPPKEMTAKQRAMKAVITSNDCPECKK